MDSRVPLFQWNNIEAAIKSELKNPSNESLFRHIEDQNVTFIEVGTEKIPLDQITLLALELFRHFPNQIILSTLSLVNLQRVVKEISGNHPNQEVLKKCTEAISSLLLLRQTHDYLETCGTLSTKLNKKIPEVFEKNITELRDISLAWTSEIENKKEIPPRITWNFKYMQFDLGSLRYEYKGIIDEYVKSDTTDKTAKHLARMNALMIEDLFNENTYLYKNSDGQTALHWAVASKDHEALNLLLELAKIKNIDLLKEAFQSDLDGMTPLELSFIYLNDPYLLEQILKSGKDINTFRIGFVPFLQHVISSQNVEKTHWLLEQQGIDPTLPNMLGRNALHAAVESGSQEIIIAILNHPKGKQCLTLIDNYDYTPVDLAFMKKNEAMISLLTGDHDLQVHQKSPLYGNAPNEIDQDKIIHKFVKYFEIMGRKIEDTAFNISGECNGLSFLHNYYCSKGKEDEFFDIQNSICQWDESKDSLSKPEKVLQYKGKYRDLEDIFEQWINDVTWFQKSTDKIGTFYSQSDRQVQYMALKASNEDIELSVQLQEKELQMDLKFLAKTLELYQLYNKGWSFEITAPRHTMGFTIDRQGYFHFYDPNGLHRSPPIQNPEQAAKMIYAPLYWLSSPSLPGLSMGAPLNFGLRAYILGSKGMVEETLETRKQENVDQFCREADRVGIPASHAALLSLNKPMYDLIAAKDPSSIDEEFMGVSARVLASTLLR